VFGALTRRLSTIRPSYDQAGMAVELDINRRCGAGGGGGNGVCGCQGERGRRVQHGNLFIRCGFRGRGKPATHTLPSLYHDQIMTVCLAASAGSGREGCPDDNMSSTSSSRLSCGKSRLCTTYTCLLIISVLFATDVDLLEIVYQSCPSIRSCKLQYLFALDTSLPWITIVWNSTSATVTFQVRRWCGRDGTTSYCTTGLRLRGWCDQCNVAGNKPVAIVIIALPSPLSPFPVPLHITCFSSISTEEPRGLSPFPERLVLSVAVAVLHDRRTTSPPTRVAPQSWRKRRR